LFWTELDVAKNNTMTDEEIYERFFKIIINYNWKYELNIENYANVQNITNNMRDTIKGLNKVKFSLNFFFF